MHLARSGPADAPGVLLLHGGGVAGWMWRPLCGALASSHHVLVPDLPGHGRSAAEPYRSHDETVGALAEMLAARASGPVTVIGFSLGAQLALRLAAEHRELVDRVIVVSAQASPARLTLPTLALLAAAAPLARRRWFARLQARELFVPPELLADYLDTSARISRPTLLAAVGENMRFRLPAGWSRFPGEALIMVGARERRIMRDSAAAIHEALPGSTLEIVPGAGHGVPLQRPSWFAEHVRTWLDASTSG